MVWFTVEFRQTVKEHVFVSQFSGKIISHLFNSSGKILIQWKCIAKLKFLSEDAVLFDTCRTSFLKWKKNQSVVFLTKLWSQFWIWYDLGQI